MQSVPKKRPMNMTFASFLLDVVRSHSAETSNKNFYHEYKCDYWLLFGAYNSLQFSYVNPTPLSCKKTCLCGTQLRVSSQIKFGTSLSFYFDKTHKNTPTTMLVTSGMKLFFCHLFFSKYNSMCSMLYNNIIKT